LVDGSYINGVSSDLLYTVSPNVPPGYISQINSIRFSIKDQDSNFVN